jgi:hypothetical protein
MVEKAKKKIQMPVCKRQLSESKVFMKIKAKI